MRRSLACFCFDEGSLRGHDIARIVAETVKFETPHIMARHFMKNGGTFKPEAHLAKIASLDEVGFLILGLPSFEGNYFDFGGIGAWDFETLSWCCPIDQLPEKDFFDQLAQQPGFNAGYVSDADDVLWQSEPLISNYELFGKSHNGMPKRWDEDFEEEQIDTLKNPGARHPIPGMWLHAAWRMWFGTGAFRFIPREKLLSFADAHRVESQAYQTVFIELFADPASYDSKAIRTKQASFNAWVGKADLVARGADLITGPNDPSLEIEHGAFEHGGVKRVTAWFDEAGDSVVRSRAATCDIQEVDEKGGVIWHRVQRIKGEDS